MNISKMLENIGQYFTQAIARIFSPTDDEYPSIGVQPYEGESFKEGNGAEQ